MAAGLLAFSKKIKNFKNSCDQTATLCVLLTESDKRCLVVSLRCRDRGIEDEAVLPKGKTFRKQNKRRSYVFEQKEIDAYQNIKAPIELRERILDVCESGVCKKESLLTNRRFIKQVSSIAACFLLVIALFSFTVLNGSDITLSYENEHITESGASILRSQVSPAGHDTTTPRAVSQITLPITVSCEKKATVRVSQGVLFGVDENGEAGDELGQSIEIDGETSLIWVVDADAEACELLVKSGIHREVYGLEIAENSPTGTIYKK